MDGLISLVIFYFIYRWIRAKLGSTGNTGKTKTGSSLKDFFESLDSVGSGRWQEMKTPWQGIGQEMQQPGKPFSYFPEPEPTAFKEPEHYEMRTSSFDSDSLEGRDICDPALGHNQERIPLPTLDVQEPLEAAPAAFLEFTGDALVRSVVMSEILTRPSQRRWRGR